MLKGVDISKRFGAQTILKSVSVTIEANECVAFVGPSGSGKSTLLAILSALLQPDEGEVLLNNKTLTPALARENIAWVPQGSNCLLHRSVLHNAETALLAKGRKTRNELANQALEIVGLGEHAHKRANQLSGGERQRLAVARAIATGRDLIFADEPTGSLDTANTELVVETLLRVKDQQGSLVLATHDPFVMRLADRVINIDANIAQKQVPQT